MYSQQTIPQSKIRDFCQPPLHKGAFLVRLLFVANSTALCYDKQKGGGIVKLAEVKKLLDDNNYTYAQTVIPSRAEFYRQKGFRPSIDTGAFTLLTIPNPNHEKDIQIIFNDETENPEFYDLEFGSFWYELFDCEEEHLPQELLTEIQRIVSGSTYVIFACTIKKGIHWSWDGVYYDLPDDEMNSMDAFRNAVSRIKFRKSWWQKLTGKTDIYEIFNWISYERITK